MEEKFNRVKELYRKLKKLTGYKQSDVADKFSISRQAVDQYSNNHFTVYQNCNRYMILTMLDIKIDEYKEKIKELEEFKQEVKEVKL